MRSRKFILAGVKEGIVRGCILLWGVSMTAAVAGEVPRAEIEKQIRALESPVADERESATEALVKIGEPAGEAVYLAAKSKDPEIAQRAEDILRRIGWVTLEIRDAIRSLRSTRDIETWNRKWGEIARAGKGAQEALRRELDTPDGEASLKIELPARIDRGKPFDVALLIVNGGKSGFWSQADRLRLEDRPSSMIWSHREAGSSPADSGSRLRDALRQRAMGALAASGEVPYLYVAPGESYARTFHAGGGCVDCVGRIRLEAAYGDAPAPDPSNLLSFILAQVKAPAGKEATDVQARPLARELKARSEWVYVLPEGKASTPGLSLSFVGKVPAIPEKGPIGVRLSLRNDSVKAVTLPATGERLTPGFWYALLDAKGGVVQAGLLDGREQCARGGNWSDAAPGKTVEVAGEIVPQVPAGIYRLVCGFSLHASFMDEAAPSLQEPMAMGGGARVGIPGSKGGGKPVAASKLQWIGDALTDPVEVSIGETR